MMSNKTRTYLCGSDHASIYGFDTALCCPAGFIPASQEIESIREAIREQKRIIHAGGPLKTKTGELVFYTNMDVQGDNLKISGKIASAYPES